MKRYLECKDCANSAPHPPFGHPLPAVRGEGVRRGANAFFLPLYGESERNWMQMLSFSPPAGRRWRNAPDEGRAG